MEPTWLSIGVLAILGVAVVLFAAGYARLGPQRDPGHQARQQRLFDQACLRKTNMQSRANHTAFVSRCQSVSQSDDVQLLECP